MNRKSLEENYRLKYFNYLYVGHSPTPCTSIDIDGNGWDYDLGCGIINAKGLYWNYKYFGLKNPGIRFKIRWYHIRWCWRINNL